MINSIIRTVSIMLISKIGFKTFTIQTSAVMILVTTATYFNTAILILLTNANTEDTVLEWLPLRGAYSDLNANWYL